MRIRDASFTRSFDPCSSILTMHCRVKPRWWGALEGIAAGQTCVSRTNQHRGHRSGRQRGSPRITARESGVVRKKRKTVEAVVPARKRGPRFGCPHVSEVQLQKSIGGV